MGNNTDHELSLFFDNSMAGAFIMLLDEPVFWNNQDDKEKTLDYVTHHMRFIRVNQAFLNQLQTAEKNVLEKTLNDVLGNKTDQKNLFRNIFDRGKYRVARNEISTDGTVLFFEVDYVVIHEHNDPKGRISGIFGVQNDITKQAGYQKKLLKSLEEKKILLSEIHHRIKNNLSIVSGLLQLQAMDTDDLTVQNHLTNSMFRIQTMATIHEILYSNRDYSKIEFATIVEKLIYSIRDVLLSVANVDINIQKSSIHLSVNQAIPLSLIINELATNIFKHAFNGKKRGLINVKIDKKLDNHLEMIIEDDGVGFPDNFDMEKSTSLGLFIVRSLTRQLKGTYSLTNTDPGSRFTLQFKLEDVGISATPAV